MSKEFAAFRLKPGEDDDIIEVLEKTSDKTKFIKGCIRTTISIYGTNIGHYDEEAEVNQ